MNKRILVYGKTIDRAMDKLEDILNNIPHGDIHDVRKSRSDMQVLLKNGDLYNIVTASESSRGHKWKYAYIDKDISIDIFNRVILPSGIDGDYEFY